jgi:segregation and condensation protein B
MSVKAKVEAIIYATEEPVTISQLASLLREAVLAELLAEEEARLVLNETVSDGKPEPSEDENEDFAAPETAIAQSEAEPHAEAKPSYFSGQLLGPDDLTEEQQAERAKDESKQVKAHLGRILEELTAEYAAASHGVEVRQIAGGYRMGTKPEHHDVVVGFAKSLKPPVRLSLQALETLAVIAYKQPVTVPEISEIRGVDSSGVIATLLDRKLVTTSGRKQVIGRPILYKTTKEFLLRFGLNNVAELPSMEEFEKLGDPQADLFAPTTSEPAAADGPLEKQQPPAEPEAAADETTAETAASGALEGEATPLPDNKA